MLRVSRFRSKNTGATLKARIASAGGDDEEYLLSMPTLLLPSDGTVEKVLVLMNETDWGRPRRLGQEFVSPMNLQ